MTTYNNLDSLADTSPFIFTATIRRAGASTVPALPVDNNTVVVGVEDVIRAPSGLGSFAGSEVTVQLVQSAAGGRYVFFAEPWAVGGGIAVRERAHLDATGQSVREEVTLALERGYGARIGPRLSAATLVVLGTIGRLRVIGTTDGQAEEAPWAIAPLDIEQVLKGDAKTRRTLLVGPRYATHKLPLVPPLKAGLRAVFVLQPPPKEALDAVPDGDRQGVLFISTSSDIQPHERLSTINQIAKSIR